jgi:hypothetical protein
MFRLVELPPRAERLVGGPCFERAWSGAHLGPGLGVPVARQPQHTLDREDFDEINNAELTAHAGETGGCGRLRTMGFLDAARDRSLSQWP